MDINPILKTMLLIGSDLPAYKALLDQILHLFDAADQDALKQGYVDAIAASDKAHTEAQAI